MGRPAGLDLATRPWHAPAAVAAGALAAAGFVGAVAPHGQAFYPPCPLYRLTGVYCPGCGATRAVHALATGHLGAALHDNLLIVLAVPVVAIAWWCWMARSLGRPAPRWAAAPRPRWWPAALVVALVAYAVMRNIGVAPFTALAPLR